MELTKQQRMVLLFFLELIQERVEDQMIKNKIEKNYKEIIKQDKKDYYKVVMNFMMKDEIKPLWENDVENIIKDQDFPPFNLEN